MGENNVRLALTASEVADLERSAGMLAVERAEYRIAYANLRAVGQRVIAAFDALGKANGVIPSMQRHQECEAAIVALNAALAKEPTP